MNDSLALDLPRHKRPGKLIVFDGIDGSGKSTLIEAAMSRARALDKPVVMIDLLNDRVRELPEFRTFAHDPAASVRTIDLLALSLVCAGNRLQHVKTQVAARLAEGAWVFCDRYIFTTWSEFAALSESPRDAGVLRTVLELFPRPDLGILPHASAETSIERVRTREHERGKVLDRDRFAHVIATYRRVAAANGLMEISTERPRAECEALVARAIEELSAGPTTGATYRPDR